VVFVKFGSAAKSSLVARAAFLLAFVVFLGTPVSSATAQSEPVPSVRAIDALALSAMRDYQLAGLSVAVRRGGVLLHAAGYGSANVELSAPARPDTVYRVGSITKQFTAVLALRMAQQGLISLDAPIGRYLPELKSAGDVTLRQLLNHTAGIASFDPDVMPAAFKDRAAPMSKASMLAFIDGAPRDFPPGTQFRYGNSGYLLVGLALERISGLDYDSLLAREILTPAGLDRTQYDSLEAIIPGRASGYVRRGERLFNAEWNSPSRPFAAGALISTTMDLLRWNDRLYGGHLLSKESLAVMTTAGRLGDGQEIPYGLGVRIGSADHGKRLAHGGLIVGFSGFLSHYTADDLNIAILTNTQDRGRALGDLEIKIAEEIKRSLSK
jgi:CubicO group peptidase (beta-lactamase class C family)